MILRLQLTRAFQTLIDRLIHPAPSPRSLAAAANPAHAEWLAAMEDGRLHPPVNVHDAVAWDTYWNNHLRAGLLEQGFADMMSSDERLAGLLSARGARSILCAGNGMSGEALALALFGFDVTALDISAVPGDSLAETLRQPDHPLHAIPGFSIADTNVFRWEQAAPIDAERCPRIHRNDNFSHRGGGSLSFVTGDLTNADVCRGPFDVVIERRAVQLFPEPERIGALQQLIARLGGRGVFVSQQHFGWWKPGQPLNHYGEEWLRAEGFVVRMRSDSERELVTADRLALLKLSTG